VSQIVNYVETHSTYAPGRYWAGFMFDEEPGYNFSASELEALNSYTANLMVNEPGMSWYFTENQPNGWTLSTYNAIINGSWPAPQAYSSSMVSAINSECSTYSSCINLVTIDSAASGSWSSASYVTALVNGAPWNNSTWGSSGYWYNMWRPQ
jgi:hypothetical protein